MQEQNKKNEKPPKDDKLITLVILTADGGQPWEHDFPKTLKVSELIAAIVAHFNLAPDGQYEVRRQKDLTEPMRPERPLQSYHLEDGDRIVFTDFGKGV